MPAGMEIDSVRGLRTRPLPLQELHGDSMILPGPLQYVHGADVMN